MMNTRRMDFLTQLRSLTFKFDRSEKLVEALDRCAVDYFSKLKTGKPFEARGLLVTGRSRVGKTHELERAIQGFNEQRHMLPNGKTA